VPAGDCAAVAGELDEVELVRRSDCAREVGDKEEGALERRDEDQIQAPVVGGNLRPEL
jgi:hypothetical protein